MSELAEPPIVTSITVSRFGWCEIVYFDGTRFTAELNVVGEVDDEYCDRVAAAFVKPAEQSWSYFKRCSEAPYVAGGVSIPHCFHEALAALTQPPQIPPETV